MSSPVFDRRRAERFAQLLEANGRRNHRRRDADGDLAALVRLSRRAGQMPTAPPPDPEFRTGLRAMLIAKMERDGVGVTAVERAAHAANRAALAGKTQAVRQVPAGAGRTRAAVLIGVTAGALVLSGVSAASTDSLPGEPLYQVKRSTEQAQLALAGSDLSRGKLHLEFAYGRLLEARRVGPDLLAGVFADMDHATRLGVRLLTASAAEHGDGAALDIVLKFVSQQGKRLDDLERTLPPAGGEPARKSAALLNAVEARAKGLKAALAARCRVGQLDDLGPKPTSC